MSEDKKLIPIVFLIDVFSRGGGMENQLGNLIDNLDRGRFKPYLFTLKPHWRDEKPMINCPTEILNVLSLYSLSFIRGAWRLAKFLKENKVPILHTFQIDSTFVGALTGLFAPKTKILISRRDMGYWHTSRLLKMLNIAGRFVDYCVTNANAIKEIVCRTEPFEPERVKVIYNGVIFPEDHAGAAVTRDQFGIPEQVPLIGIAANLRPVKRLDRFVRAAAAIKNKQAHFMIMGFGKGREELTALAEELGVADRLHFHHTVENAFQVLKLFDVGVLTSETEGLSNVLIEYALAEVPAVAFDTGGNPEIIVENETGFLVPDHDIARMAEGIDYLIEHPTEAHLIGLQAAERARAMFSIPRMVEESETFYLELISSR
jgi:glycosyltransferase involved in cell wall biosynthesis